MSREISIFVIEDNQKIAKAIKNNLQSNTDVKINVSVFSSVSSAIENNIKQPEILFVNHTIFSKVNCKEIESLEDLIKGIHIVPISGERETKLFSKALRSGADYYIPDGTDYLNKVNNFIDCYLTDSIPDKTTLLKQWYFELAKEDN